jgi:peptide-methionine (S)-S-oxide reductase
MKRALISIALVLGAVLALHCQGSPSGPGGAGARGASNPNAPAPLPDGPGLAKATFAGGCFWCMEAPFDELDGVKATTSGYTGGDTQHPTYEDVSAGGTGHVEAMQVLYDPTRVTYQKLLQVFWHNVDPTVTGRQFCDSGDQYQAIVFYADETQKELAEASKEEIERTKPFKDPIVTPIRPLTQFWPAEEYHQDFYKKEPLRYRFYRAGCGRDRRLQELWGKAAGH